MQRRELADATLPREWQWGRACTIVNNEAASSRAACSIASPMLLKAMVIEFFLKKNDGKKQ
jgi:hypothetical protein